MRRFWRARLGRIAWTVGGLVALLGGSAALTGVGAAAAGDPVLVAAGDIASCESGGDEATAALLDGIPGTVAALGDTVYPDGTAADYANCYAPSWGRHRARTRPAIGNHEYQVDDHASGYFGYFGAAAGEPGKGYYSYDLGAWHIVVLNSECWAVGGCATGSPQDQWLRADLAAHPAACTLAYFHRPRFSSGPVGGDAAMQPFWDALYAAGADVILNGHDHVYERFAPQSPGGAADPNGIRQFTVGTGGDEVWDGGTVQPNSEVRRGDTFGVLKLTLHDGGYDWQFVPVAGKTFADNGSAACSTALGPNLLPNPSFEQDPHGWFTWQAALTRVAGGHAGNWAARLTPTCECSGYALLAASLVKYPRQGDRYRASAWVRGDARLGTQVRLILRERGGATDLEMTQAPVALRGAWQRLQVEHTIRRTDRSALDLFVKQFYAQPGDAFITDDIAVNRVLGGSPPPPPPPVNLIGNPSFESSLTGWYPWHAGVSRVSGGKDGNWAARVALGCACTEYTLDDVPDAVSHPPRGATYRATAWVKAAGATGTRVSLTLREQGGATGSQSTSSASVALSSDWQQLGVSRSVAQGDRTSLGVHVGQAGAAGGDAFLVDAISLVRD